MHHFDDLYLVNSEPAACLKIKKIQLFESVCLYNVGKNDH